MIGALLFLGTFVFIVAAVIHGFTNKPDDIWDKR